MEFFIEISEAWLAPMKRNESPNCCVDIRGSRVFLPNARLNRPARIELDSRFAPREAVLVPHDVGTAPRQVLVNLDELYSYKNDYSRLE